MVKLILLAIVTGFAMAAVHFLPFEGTHPVVWISLVGLYAMAFTGVAAARD